MKSFCRLEILRNELNLKKTLFKTKKKLIQLVGSIILVKYQD